MASVSGKIAAIVGVGPGLGQSLSKKYVIDRSYIFIIIRFAKEGYTGKANVLDR